MIFSTSLQLLLFISKVEICIVDFEVPKYNVNMRYICSDTYQFPEITRMNDIFSFTIILGYLYKQLSQILFGRIQTAYGRISDSLFFRKMLSFGHLRSFGCPILPFFLPNIRSLNGTRFPAIDKTLLSSPNLRKISFKSRESQIRSADRS